MAFKSRRLAHTLFEIQPADPTEAFVLMVYSEGTTAMTSPSATGMASVVANEMYELTIEILRNDLGSASEKDVRSQRVTR